MVYLLSLNSNRERERDTQRERVLLVQYWHVWLEKKMMEARFVYRVKNRLNSVQSICVQNVQSTPNSNHEYENFCSDLKNIDYKNTV